MNCARMFEIDPRIKACAVPVTSKDGIIAETMRLRNCREEGK